MMGTDYGIANDFFSKGAYFRRHAIWKLVFAWLPHKCELSGKIIWLKRAYKGEYRIGDYMDSVDIRWRTSDSHILELITQD